jgi:hypothetical protein
MFGVNFGLACSINATAPETAGAENVSGSFDSVKIYVIGKFGSEFV